MNVKETGIFCPEVEDVALTNVMGDVRSHFLFVAWLSMRAAVTTYRFTQRSSMIQRKDLLIPELLNRDEGD
jgi:hypothetical protein